MLTRRHFHRLAASVLTGFALGVSPGNARPLAARRLGLVPFATAPFPYRGKLPASEVDFLDVQRGGRRGHTSPRGGVYWEDETYSDNRVLLALPRGFDRERRFAIVVYFHGNGETLERDVIGRQAVVDQLEASGLNAVLIAPQFAVNALDSSAGRFWQRGAFSAFMKEASGHLADLASDTKLATSVRSAPVVLVAYSGGYDPAAYVLANGDEGARLKAVVLLDALFGEVDKFADWIGKHHQASIFVNASSPAAQEGSTQLKAELQERGLATDPSLTPRLRSGAVCFIDAANASHDDFVTEAWTHWPLEDVLKRMR